jgi:hypothetical protein
MARGKHKNRDERRRIWYFLRPYNAYSVASLRGLPEPDELFFTVNQAPVDPKKSQTG